jgi:hypothetical protein
MRTQSPDTHPEAERVQIALMRGFSPARKFAQIVSFTNTLAQASYQHRTDPVQFITTQYGAHWAKRFKYYVPTHLPPHTPYPDLHAALLHVIDRLEQRRIPYALAGRLACSLYGFPRSIDVLEIAVDYPHQIRISPFHTRIREVYLDTVNLVCIHMYHMPHWLFQAQKMHLFDGRLPLMVVSPEDVVLHLLKQYEEGGRRDDALYNDVLALVKTQAFSLDVAAMFNSGQVYGALRCAFTDAGMYHA